MCVPIGKVLIKESDVLLVDAYSSQALRLFVFCTVTGVYAESLLFDMIEI